jgi:hypothetical protein
MRARTLLVASTLMMLLGTAAYLTRGRWMGPLRPPARASKGKTETAPSYTPPPVPPTWYDPNYYGRVEETEYRYEQAPAPPPPQPAPGIAATVRVSPQVSAPMLPNPRPRR